MAGKQRLNKIIDLLEQDKVVFGGIFVRNGNIDDAMLFADLRYDFVIIEMEHEGFDLNGLRLSLQFLLSRAQLVAGGTLAPHCAPLVRIPPNAREENQWIFKQVLDSGAYGLVVPQVGTVAGAQAAVVASRYPRPAGSPGPETIGERGIWRRSAPRYWGLSSTAYFEAADLWPLNPDGEILLMPIIETVEGVRNLPDILSQVKGIGAVWAGAGDLSVSMGHPLESAHPEVEEGMQQILAVCKDHDVPCGILCGPNDVERRIGEGFRIVISMPTTTDAALAIGRKLTEGSANA
jgi:4-hydroxy-2-oxoheptanedioate aldolase